MAQGCGGRGPDSVGSPTLKPPVDPGQARSKSRTSDGSSPVERDRPLVGDGRAVTGRKHHLAEADLAAGDLDPGVPAGARAWVTLALAEQRRRRPRASWWMVTLPSAAVGRGDEAELALPLLGREALLLVTRA